MIICFGEVLIDCLPNQTLIGGAPFNVAINLKRFGLEVAFVSQIGNDDFGDKIHQLAKEEKIDSFIKKSDGLPTGHVNVTFIDQEPKYTIEKNTAWHYIKYQEPKSTPSHFIFGSLATFFDFNKKTLCNYKESYPQTKFVCDLNIREPYISDSHILFCLETANFLKINEDELSHLYQIFDIHNEKDLFDFLQDKFNIEQLLITLGDKGARFLNKSGSYQEHPTPIPKRDFKECP